MPSDLRDVEQVAPPQLELLSKERLTKSQRTVVLIYIEDIAEPILRAAFDVHPQDVMEFVFFRTNEIGCALCKNLKEALVLQRAPYSDFCSFVGPVIVGRVRRDKISILNAFSQNGTLCFGDGVLTMEFDRVDDDPYPGFC